jgi:hypothetical protein
MYYYNTFSGGANILFSSDLISLVSARADFSPHLISFEHQKDQYIWSIIIFQHPVALKYHSCRLYTVVWKIKLHWLCYLVLLCFCGGAWQGTAG